MFVKQYGRGPRAFYCLHGWSGDHRTFEPLAQLLPDDARLYAADLPGCGDSSPPERWDLRSISQEIQHAFETIDASEVTLVGSCIGALLGMHAALGKPQLLHRLVLIDAFAQWPWYFRVFTAPGWGKYAYTSTFANPIGRWITNRALAARRTQESDLTEGFSDRRRHEAALHYLQVIREIESVTEFAPLAMPVDVIFGSRSFRAVHDSAQVWQEMWPQTRVWKIPNAGHLVLREAAVPVSEIVFGGGACQPVSSTTSNSAQS